MSTHAVGIGVVLILVGIPQAVWPYRVARLSERLDAIGSKRHWDGVEPADWKVVLTRVAALIGIGLGVLLILGEFLL